MAQKKRLIQAWVRLNLPTKMPFIDGDRDLDREKKLLKPKTGKCDIEKKTGKSQPDEYLLNKRNKFDKSIDENKNSDRVFFTKF